MKRSDIPTTSSFYGSPPPKKNLFGSPKSSSSPSAVRKNVTGYLIAKGEVQVAKTKNTYFNCKIKISDSEYEMIRVMTMGMSKDDEEFFTLNIGKVVRLQSISDTGNTQFYNKKKLVPGKH